MAVNIKFLWKDRKRYLGMPLSFTRYQLSDDRLFLSGCDPRFWQSCAVPDRCCVGFDQSLRADTAQAPSPP